MIKNYDNFLNENNNDRIFSTYINTLYVDKDIFSKNFFIKDIIHKKLDVDSYKIIQMYDEYFFENKYITFIVKSVFEYYKNLMLPKLKNLNLGIKDILLKSNNTSDYYFPSREVIKQIEEYKSNKNYYSKDNVWLECVIVVNKSFMTNILNLVEDLYIINDDEYFKRTYYCPYKTMKNDIENFITNINRKKSNVIELPYLNDLILKQIKNKPNDHITKKDIDVIVNKDFKPINFVNFYNSEDTTVYDLEKTKPYNL